MEYLKLILIIFDENILDELENNEIEHSGTVVDVDKDETQHIYEVRKVKEQQLLITQNNNITVMEISKNIIVRLICL